MARIPHISGDRRSLLEEGWEVVAVEPGRAADPASVSALPIEWKRAIVPGTAAAAERESGARLFETKRDFDAVDWWYRCKFAMQAPAGPGARHVLVFGGLASSADVWCNGTHVLSSNNMFVGHEVDVTALVRPTNDIHIRFASMRELLKRRHPRPRWRTRLVEQQSLRFHRTTLLGRMPAFTPPVSPVGPYRAVSVEERQYFHVRQADVRAELRGDDGIVTAALSFELFAGHPIESARLVVGDRATEMSCSSAESEASTLTGELRIAGVPKWWPHTHGAQPRFGAKVVVRIDSTDVAIDLGKVAFRSVELDNREGEFALRVNGEPVFCRGACWMPDIVTLGGDEAWYRSLLERARQAGMNMMRVPGTNLYEADIFYELASELGILVWQDFMFANMDYPEDDSFVSSATHEVQRFLDRTQLDASLAMLCGGSEVEQQVAMIGLPRDAWDIPLFRKHIPEVCRRKRPDVPYFPSTPSGGALPFHVNAGAAHYYGVGAYLRPLEDARRAEVRFASECLAFANVPHERTLDAMAAGGVMTPQHARWKERAPRDQGASWDFDDVRDHYLERLFRVNARELRTTDIDRYLALGRVVTGEVMAAVFGEWRRRRSTCKGGLVFTYRDLWPGAGFGVVDALGRPKAAYFYLKRTMAPMNVFLSDEGTNGLWIHAVNETAHAVAAELRVTLYREGEISIASTTSDWPLPPRGSREASVDGLLGRFLDTSYAYRFGPPGHDLVVATLFDKATGAQVAQAFHFPLGIPAHRESDVGLEATAEKLPGGEFALTMHAKRFAQSVNIDADGVWPEDDYFHLEPGVARTVKLCPLQPALRLSGRLVPLNAHKTAHFAAEG